MDVINSNIKFIRKQKGLTQQKFADLIGIKRSSLGAYEEGRAKPGYDTIQTISRLYRISIDKLITQDLSGLADQFVFGGVTMNPVGGDDIEGRKMRILSITVDKDNTENVVLVPEKAHATYMRGYGDPQFISKLDNIKLPFLDANTSYRAFQIEGDSMLPVKPGSYIVGEYIENWNNIKTGETYVIVSDDGVVYKRVENKINKDQTLILHSDNKLYPPVTLELNALNEVWKAVTLISTTLPDPPNDSNTVSLSQLLDRMNSMQREIDLLKQRI